MGVKVLQWPATHVKGNIGHWGHESHEREINKSIALTLGRKCIIIEWQIHTFGHCEEMQVECGSESFTVADTPFQRELRT